MSRRVFAYIFAAAAALCFGAASASAASPSAPNWSGFYGGVHAGYGSGTDAGCGAWNGGSTYLPVNWPPNCDVDPSNHNYSVDGPFKGWLGGGQIGDNFQSGEFVAGGELSASLSGLEHRHFDLPSFNITEKLNPLLTATVHAGIAPGPFYVYGLVGYGGGHQTHDDEVSDCHWDINVGGLVYGGGAQVMLSSKVSLFGEWNHLAFNDAHATCINSLNNTNNIVKTTGDIFKAGLNFHFN